MSDTKYQIIIRTVRGESYISKAEFESHTDATVYLTRELNNADHYIWLSTNALGAVHIMKNAIEASYIRAA